jgi:hypothetical protein
MYSMHASALDDTEQLVESKAIFNGYVELR